MIDIQNGPVHAVDAPILYWWTCDICEWHSDFWDSEQKARMGYDTHVRIAHRDRSPSGE